jgi:hypothetical protein
LLEAGVAGGKAYNLYAAAAIRGKTHNSTSEPTSTSSKSLSETAYILDHSPALYPEDPVVVFNEHRDGLCVGYDLSSPLSRIATPLSSTVCP